MHRLPLLSLENATNEEEIRDFDLRVKKVLGMASAETIDYICEPKIDGLAVELIYEQGLFTTASTRGDVTASEIAVETTVI